jgi:uncharacterized OsmC-like protein
MLEVSAVWKKNYQVSVTARQFEIPVDEAPQYHGDDTGMMPTELFLASVASCFCLALVYAARKKRVEIQDMRVDAEGYTDIDNFTYTKINVKVESSLEPQKLEDIMVLAKRYCFVSNAITQSCPIEYETVHTEE